MKRQTLEVPDKPKKLYIVRCSLVTGGKQTRANNCQTLESHKNKQGARRSTGRLHICEDYTMSLRHEVNRSQCVLRRPLVKVKKFYYSMNSTLEYIQYTLYWLWMPESLEFRVALGKLDYHLQVDTWESKGLSSPLADLLGEPNFGKTSMQYETWILHCGLPLVGYQIQ